MSQVSIIDIEGNHPQIPTQFDANVGFAIPIANVLEILGASVAAGSVPVQTVGSGNTITTNVQISQAIAASNANNVGLAAFDSDFFTVDANGFVSFVGGGVSLAFNVDAATAPGTDPVLPSGLGTVTVTGGQVAAGTTTNVIQTNSLAANTYAIQIQRASAQAGSVVGSNGVSHFNSSEFTVDSNGFVSLIGGGLAIDSIGVQTGTSPIVPTVAGLVTINGAVVAAGTNPIRTDGTGANTMAVEVQISQAIAAADATKIGLANFSSTDFAVAATGFVTLSTTGAAKTITGDSGGALSPTANNWNILGLSGSKTSGAASTLTIKSPPYADLAGSGSVTLNSGSFATNAITLTTPVTAGLADGDLLEFIATNGVLVIQLAATQVAHLGNTATSIAGTITGSATGDSISLRYQASTNDWWATSSVGVWVLA